MRAPTDVPRLRDYARMVAHGWLIIVLATLLSAGAAAAAPRVVKAPQYEASVLLFATVTGDPGTWSTYFAGLGSNVRMPTYAELAKSNVVTLPTIGAAHLQSTPGELAKRITAGWVPGGISRFGRPNSALLQISVTDKDPQRAVDTVNALAVNLMRVSRELEWTASKPTDAIQFTGPAAELVPVDPAKTAHRVLAPIWKNVGIGAGVGLVLSTMLVVALGLGRDALFSRGHVKHVVRQAMAPSPARTRWVR